MLDPLTVTTTIITLATFIKDLIELGEGIRSSIEKVSENRRQIRELAQDIVRTLYDLASLTCGKEDAFRGSELLDALENLKAEMLHVHSKCLKISPVQLPGLWGVKSQLKAWRKRDDLEKKITRLRERVNKCFLQFTAFSAARTEHVALRIEQRLVVDGMENHVKARRLEGMVAQLLLDSNFGRHKLGETIEVISSDPTFRSLESQYMSVQLKSLINSIERLLASGNLTFEFDPFEDIVYRPVFIDPTILTPCHALIQLLQLVVEINGTIYAAVPLRSMGTAWSRLGIQLSYIGMFSEANAWNHFNIACFRHASKTDYGTRALPNIANKLHHISVDHRDRFETTLALQLSQQSLDFWIQSSEILPCDHRIGTLASMTLHADNLLTSNEKAAALSTAKDAASIARAIMTELMECISNVSSLTDEEVFEATQSREGFFVLARVLSSSNRDLDSYAAFMEGFQTAQKLPVPSHPPSGRDIDSFIDVICKLAESGYLSLPMLTECMMLFRDLARIYQYTFSYEFLRLLHALVYFSQQSAPSLCNIRLFMEPGSASPMPELDIAKPILNDLDVVQDAVRLFYTEASEHCTAPLIQNILVAHFQTAIAVLRDLERSFDLLRFTWVPSIACWILPLLTRPDFSTLLSVLGETIQRFSSNFVIMDLELPSIFSGPLHYICRHALKIGAYDEGLQLCKHVAEYLTCPFHNEDGPATWLQLFLLLRAFIFCDAARFGDAIQAMQESDSPLSSFHWQVDRSYFLPYHIMRTRILLRMGRHLEALTVIKRALTLYLTQDPTFDVSLYFLFTQLSVVWGLLGHPQRALENAEKAVEFCEKVEVGYEDDDMNDIDDEDLVSLRIYSLTTLSNCQAAAVKSIKALKSAQDAVSIYAQNEQETWGELFVILRKQALGGNAFFALSQRLAGSGHPEQALANGKKAIDLYRELVKVAPRHFPTLANGLRHLASVLQDSGGQDEAIAACEEAVEIMRGVADAETYFLPDLADVLDQFAVLLVEQGDTGSAAAVTAEASEARRKFVSLPAGPEWLFGKVVDSGDEEDLDWWDLMESHDTLEDPGWLFEKVADSSDEEELEWWELTEYRDALEDPASEGDDMDIEDDDEYQDALDTAKFVEVTEPEPAIIEGVEGQPSSSPAATSRAMDLTQVAVESRSASLLVPIDEDFPKQDPPSAISKTQAVVNNALTRPLMLKLSMSMQSRPVDVIWWILLAVLFAIFVYTRIA
ncbi:Tetratricopeptide repeat family [Favolaschia claudopus]|uniref:Tetratricopeptide repeat family n=1 Tax=Favolaschia claudopus TaxID=2862362 RepID=A0AAV9Z6F0_9AGAR